MTSKMLLSGAFALTIFLIFGCNEKKQKPDTAIRGIVLNQSGQPEPQVAVMLDGTTYQAITNRQGKFTISGFPYGTYTAVSYKPGCLPAAEYNLEISKERKSAVVRLVLKPDPDYIPDSLRIIDIVPPPESVLTPGHDITVKFHVEYTLSSDAYATIAVSYQDDKGNALMPMPSQVTVTARKGHENFGQTIRVPSRMNGKVYVIAALFSQNATESQAADRVTYYVRPYPDRIKVSELELTTGSALATGKEVSAKAVIDYFLKSFPKAKVQMQVRGDVGNKLFEVVLHQESHEIEKIKDGKGSLTYQPKFFIPSNVTAVRLKVTMTPDEMTEPLIIQWSKPCPTDKSPIEDK